MADKTYKEVIEGKRKEMLSALLDSMENDPVAWQKGWFSVSQIPQNGLTGKKYRGLNVLFLYGAAKKKGFEDPRWVTFNQAHELGATIKAGEKASSVFFYREYDKATKRDFDPQTIAGFSDEEQRAYYEENVCNVLKYSAVFNAEQCENFPELKTQEMSEEELRNSNKLVNEIINNSEAHIYSDGGDRAYYNRATDSIHIPKFNRFNSMNSLYATVLHEIAHSTGHKTRLNRDLTGEFGSQKYALEELRAELASVFIQVDLGINLAGAEVANHAAYCRDWLTAIRDDPMAFYKAVTDADRICKYISTNFLKNEIENTKETKVDEVKTTSATVETQMESQMTEETSTKEITVEVGTAAVAPITAEEVVVDDTANGKKPFAIWRVAQREKRLSYIEKNIPQEMKDLPNWCAFSTAKSENGGYKKKIWNCNVVGERKWAKSNDSSTWASFSDALEYARKNGCDGLSFALSPESGIFCVDLDDCKINGKYTDTAWGVYNVAKQTYCERSVSKEGLHFFGKKAPGVDFSSLGNKNADSTFEYYDNSRFISVTGDVFMKSKNELRVFSESDKLIPVIKGQLPVKQELKPVTDYHNTVSDDEVIKRIRKSKKAAEFDRMFAGEDICGDRNRTDLKFMNILGYFTNGDAEQMKRIFENSGLYRGSEKSRGYVDRTVKKALGSLYGTPDNLGAVKKQPPLIGM